MVKIQLELEEEINKYISIEKINRDLNTKEETIIQILTEDMKTKIN